LGADTVVVLDGRILGKPRHALDAYRMLYRLSGTTHRVLTGVALVDAPTGRALVRTAVSTVRMKKLPLERLLRLARRHLDKAGAYAIQERSDPIARVVQGSYDNVVGLPVRWVRRLMARLRVTPAPF
jgi:septum formation protein